ncbi:MAG: cyclic nucleotide-binding domain-containing protein [Thermoanaerobaculia bacterium]
MPRPPKEPNVSLEPPRKSGRSARVLDLISRRTYDEALDVLRQQDEGSPGDTALRLLQADVLVRKGMIAEATGILESVADIFAGQRLAAQAVAVLKKVQKLDPARTDLDARIVELFKAAPPPSDEPASELDETLPPARVPRKRTVTLQPPTQSPSAEEEASLLAEIADGVDVDDLWSTISRPGRSAGPRISSLLFDDFSESELLEVVRGLELLTFEAGDILITEGEQGETLYVLTSGTAKAFVKNKDAGSTQVRQLNEGDFFGEIAMLSGKRRTATITAATRCELLRLERNTLEAIVEKHPRVREVLQHFYEERAHNAAEAEIRGLDAGSSDACRAAGLAAEIGLESTPAFSDAMPESEPAGDALQQLKRVAIDHSRRQNWPDAVLAWQQYTELQPDDLDAATALGLLYGRLGRWLDAAQRFEHLVERNAADPALLFNLGLSYRQLEHLPQAAAAYRRALTLKPDYDKARQALSSVLALMKKWKTVPRAPSSAT